MTVKTATIEDVLSVRLWDKGQHGPMWYYDILLDNQERGEIGAKSDDAYHVGQTLTYTAEQTERGFKFKKYWDPNGNRNGNGGGFKKAPQAPAASPVAAQKTWGGGEDRNRSFALAYAKDLAVALVTGKEVDSAAATKRTIQIADEFLDWLNGK